VGAVIEFSDSELELIRSMVYPGGWSQDKENSYIKSVELLVTSRVEPLEFQIAEVRRVIQALKEAEGSFHGPVVDEVRRSAGSWVEAALEGRLSPEDATISRVSRRTNEP
jgi:hypothetical protein